MSTKVICLDVAFRNLGWAVYDLSLEDFVSSGNIKVTPLTKKQRKQSELSRAEEYAQLCAGYAKMFRDVLRESGCSVVLAEMPTSGGKSFNAVSAMARSAAIVSSVCALEDVQLHCIQPIASKRIVDPAGGKVEKADTIAYVKAHFDNRYIPKAVGVAEHIADAMMCIEVAKKAFPSLLQYEIPTISNPRRNSKSRRINRTRQGLRLRIRMPDARTSGN